MAQQSGIFSPKMQMQNNSPHPIRDQPKLHQQHQQAIQRQMGMRPMGPNNGMHHMHHAESAIGSGGSGGPPAASQNDSRGGNEQDASEADTKGQGGSAAGHLSGDGVEAN